MCGRYVTVHSPEDLAREFDVDRIAVEAQVAPDYNVAPTKMVPAVVEHADRDGSLERQLRAVRWGLVPWWAKDPAVGNRLINARVETAAEKPAFRRAFAKRRCILPALGYYEWERREPEGGGKAYKQPYFIHRPDDATLAMAGLYELWRDPEKDPDDPETWLWSCTVLTTNATDEAGRVHDRAPLVVPAESYEQWLAPDADDAERLRDLLVPATVGMRADPVGTAVNNVRSQSPDLIRPIADPRDSGSDGQPPEPSSS